MGMPFAFACRDPSPPGFLFVRQVRRPPGARPPQHVPGPSATVGGRRSAAAAVSRPGARLQRRPLFDHPALSVLCENEKNEGVSDHKLERARNCLPKASALTRKFRRGLIGASKLVTMSCTYFSMYPARFPYHSCAPLRLITTVS